MENDKIVKSSTDTTLDALSRLEKIGLQKRVLREIENHTGISERVLAEFTVEICESSQDFDDFVKKMVENGAEFSPLLLQSLYAMMVGKRDDDDNFSSQRNAHRVGGMREEDEEESLSNFIPHTAKNGNVPTMKEIVAYEQANKQRTQPSEAEMQSSKRPHYNNDYSNNVNNGRHGVKHRRKRLSSPERFEIKQLIASGAVKAEDFDDMLVEEGDGDGMEGDHQEPIYSDEEHIDIELAREDATFLRTYLDSNSAENDEEGGGVDGSKRYTTTKLIKNPEGSLNRAAIKAATLALERRELKSQERKEKEWANRRRGGSSKDAAALQSSAPHQQKEHLYDFPPTNIPFHHQKGQAPPSVQEQRDSLPISKLKKELLQMISEHQVMVVIGDTGSGKTTQLTQYLHEAYPDTRIACTQPRRVAATSVAKRVAEEVGCRVGELVGYQIRFEDCTTSRTRIKYMTDGMLLRECLQDPLLTSYSFVILDEAHERTVCTDVLFGLLKEALGKRPDLKIVITSATLEADKFSEYYGYCPVFRIPGRAFPVEILFSQEPEMDYLNACLSTIMQVHLCEPEGDILVFLTGQEEIESACEVLTERLSQLGDQVPPLIILPVYSAMPADLQARIFLAAPEGSRKCVIGTNIAETSITIDGIYYVIDPGFCKQKVYNAKQKMDSLIVTPISQAQSKQRAGRAGRTGPGKCFRLYTENAWSQEMTPTSTPEIQRTNLANTVLTLKAMGINDLLSFPFMDPPSSAALVAAMRNLYALGALDADGLLTMLGRKMAEFPLEPQLSKMLLFSCQLGASEEICTIVAMLTVQSPFYRPKDKQSEADQKKLRFHHPEGDHLTFLNVYDAWISNSRNPRWSQSMFLHQRTLKRAQDVREQLAGIMQKYSQPMISCRGNTELIRKCICAGFFMNAAKRDAHDEGYKTLVDSNSTVHQQQQVFMHPSSSLFNKSPAWIIYHELVLTTREYMRQVTAIKPSWLLELAPTFFRDASESMGASAGSKRGLSRRLRSEKITPLYKKFEAPNEWRLSAQKKFYKRSGNRFR